MRAEHIIGKLLIFSPSGALIKDNNLANQVPSNTKDMKWID